MVPSRSHKRTFVALFTVAALSLTSIALADTLGPVAPSADGFYRQWTPKTGSTHYTMVDEATCNGTTDYNHTTTIGRRDSYAVNLGSIPDGSMVTQISITPCASKHKSGGSNSTMKVFYRYSGVNSADAGGYSLAGTTPVSLATTNFTSLSHLKSSASTLEIGAVLSAGGKGARLGRIAVEITYTVPVAPPGAPTDLSATVVGTQVTLSWTDTSANEDGFKVERSTDGVNFTQIGTTGVNVANFTDTTSVADTVYYYRVRAYNAAGNSAYSNTTSATTAPNAPSNLAASAVGVQVSLTWTDNSQVEQDFKIERSTDGVNFAQIVSTAANSTSYTDTGSVAHTSYWYRVRAYNSAGNSAYSNVATVSTVPSAPSSLSASAAGSQVSLAWNDNSNVEDGFKIERSTDAVNYSQIDTVGANATNYTDITSVANTDYWYRIRAFNAAGNSGYTNWAMTSTIPLAPSNLVTTLSGSGIKLTWTDNTQTELNYLVERKASSSGSFVQIALLGRNETIYGDYPFSDTYTYRVRTSNDAGFSDYSNESTITLP